MPRSSASPPRVVLIDPLGWDSLSTLGAALRLHGVEVAHLGPRRLGPAAVLDRLARGRRPRDPLADLLAPPTVDVQGPEEQLAELTRGPDTAAASRVPDPAHAAALYDKLAMTRLARSLTVAVPRTWTGGPGATFPVVVKARTGAGGLAVRVAGTPAEHAAAVAELGGPARTLTQQYIASPVVSWGGVARAGKLLAGASFRVIPDPSNPLGPAVRLALVDHPPIEERTAALLGGLGYTGLVCLDFLTPETGPPLLIDANPRVFGSWLALQRLGVDLLGAYLRVLGAHPAEAAIPLVPRPEAGWRARARQAGDAAHDLRRTYPITGAALTLTASVRAARSLAGARR